jgi:conjugative transposon TraN protein
MSEMNTINSILKTILLSLFISLTTFLKSQTGKAEINIIEPYRLKITSNKTTNLIFPYAIKSVDRGSADVLAQKAKGVDNILLVKAGKEGFPETNLTVITADGKLYSFLLDYINNPAAINISFVSDTANDAAPGSLDATYNNEAAIEVDAARTLLQKKDVHIGVMKYNMTFSLNGIYIKNDIFYFRFNIANHSNINYNINLLKLFVVDEKKLKRTATQEIEIEPLHVYGDTTTIKGHGENNIVFALPKFTIPDEKYLLVELMEQSGGRNLELKVHNRTVLKAKAIK